MDFNLCRLCFQKGATSNIFKEGSNEFNISTKIMYCCSNLQIKEGDGFPSNICIYCDRELQNCYQFILKCEDTDRKLRLDVSKNLYDDCLMKAEIKSENGEENNYDEINDSFDIKSEEIEGDLPKKRQYKKRSQHEKTRRYECHDCEQKFISRSALNIHRRVHTNEKHFPCSYCDKTYKDGSNLKRHVDRNHQSERERNFICEYCGKGFYSKRDVDIHMRTHTGETPYSCNICFKSFSQCGSLMRHKKRHKGDKAHTCSICHKAFCTKEEVKNHLLVHTTERKFSCPICNISFKHQGNMNKHVKIHQEPNRFICNHCGRKFNVKGSLKIHIDSQHSEKSGYCDICSKNFPNFEAHMWRHTGYRPLKCELCTSSFFDPKALGRHINYKHKQTERFKCTTEGCLKGFPSRPMLEFHVAKLHSADIPYPCDRCSRGFYRKNDLARHKIGTHKEKLL